jgi:hypothetical protein
MGRVSNDPAFFSLYKRNQASMLTEPRLEKFVDICYLKLISQHFEKLRYWQERLYPEGRGNGLNY